MRTIGIRCDNCGTSYQSDDSIFHVLVDLDTVAEYYAFIRDVICKMQNWTCDESGDFCPTCTKKRKENQE